MKSNLSLDLKRTKYCFPELIFNYFWISITFLYMYRNYCKSCEWSRSTNRVNKLYIAISYKGLELWKSLDTIGSASPQIKQFTRSYTRRWLSYFFFLYNLWRYKKYINSTMASVENNKWRFKRKNRSGKTLIYANKSTQKVFRQSLQFLIIYWWH